MEKLCDVSNIVTCDVINIRGITAILIYSYTVIFSEKQDKAISWRRHFSLIALLQSIEGGVLIESKCKIRSRAFIWSPVGFIERINTKILWLFH